VTKGASGFGPRGAARRRGPPRALAAVRAGDAVQSVLRFRGIADEVRAGRLLTEWTDLVGQRIAQRTRPEGVFERVLVIEVASSAWLHELNILRTQIMAGLVERLGEPKLFDELKFKLAGRSRRDPVVVPRPRAAGAAVVKPRPVSTPATGAARERIVKEVEGVDDEELRELIARVRITHDR
jgi:hypothetical protein